MLCSVCLFDLPASKCGMLIISALCPSGDCKVLMYFGLYFLGVALVVLLVFQRVRILKVCLTNSTFTTCER